MERLAKYELLSKIASGGMAEIWVARTRTRTGDEMCVIKKLLPQHAENEEYKRMFLEEGRLGAALVHPNIVRMFDFGTEAGTHYLAMEYLHGEDLRVANRVNRTEGRTMPLAQAVDVVARACAGLHHAHELRGEDGAPLEIVHRDVSPHNVFLTFDGGVKVVDFGIAKSLDRRWETKHGTLKGKVPYMSPEQIKARRLDRRTDIYAMGVMLYELVLGRRPYVLSAGGDFAMMMAIARHDVRPPRELAPNIDPELEAIILRAITYDPKGRYQTMLEMSLALEEYAASRKLDTGPGPLAAYLETLFGARVEAWKAAQREDLAAHVVQIEEERAQSGLYEEESDGSKTFVAEGEPATVSKTTPSGAAGGAAPPSAASLVASTSSAVAAVIEVFGTTVVTLQGRIDEGFEGAALGGSLSGTVLLDLKGVERVTSFGVREWLEMMKAIDEQEDVDIWLARCPEAVVTQMSLIRTFAGKSKLLSFQAPFLCDDCGNTFSRTLDCEHDAPWYRDGRGEAPRCPRCGGAAKLDDDPAFLAFAAPFAGLAVPERIRTVLETVEQSDNADLDVVDKIVTKDETRVRVNRDVDRSVRWNRILDGIEGRLVVDFRGVPRVSSEGATNFARAIKALGGEVTDIEVVECPVSVLTAFGSRSPGANARPRIISIAFAGRCLACAAARTGVVPMNEVTDAAVAGRPPFVPCRRCNAALDVNDTAPSLTALFNPPSSAKSVGGGAAATESNPRIHVETPLAGQPVQRLPPSQPPSRPSARSRPPWLALVAALGALTVVLLAVAAIRARAPVSSAASSLPTASSDPVPADPDPTAAESSAVQVTPDALEINVVLRATGGEEDVARARHRAVVAAVAQLERSLAPAVRDANAAAASNTGPLTTAERFTRDVGTFASPERIAVHVESDSGFPRLTARYRIERSGWDKAVSFYESTREISGITLARSLPNRRDGLVVVAVGADKKELSRGAVLVSLDDRPATSGFEVLPRVLASSHNAVFAVGTATIPLKLK